MGGSVYTSKYVDNDIVSRARDRLVPVLHEHLLTHLRRLQGEIQQRHIDRVAETLAQASLLVAELTTTVDRDLSDDEARRIDALYAYLEREIQESGRTMDQHRLTKLIGMICSLHESWVIATRTRWPQTARPDESLHGC
jgi:flagellar protein FliS